MIETFGEDYRRYMARTSRILPGIIESVRSYGFVGPRIAAPIRNVPRLVGPRKLDCPRACVQLSRTIAATKWTAARKFRASLS